MIQGLELAIISAEPFHHPWIKGGDLTQQLGGPLIREHLQLFPPDPPLSGKRHQQRTIDAHQAGGHNGHQLQEAVQVGETAQRKGQRSQQLLTGALFASKTVEQLPQRRCCRHRLSRRVALMRRGMASGWLAAHGRPWQ